MLDETSQYAKRLAPEIAHDPIDVDRAMRWGFGWERGPLGIEDVLLHGLRQLLGGQVGRTDPGEVPLSRSEVLEVGVLVGAAAQGEVEREALGLQRLGAQEPLEAAAVHLAPPGGVDEREHGQEQQHHAFEAKIGEFYDQEVEATTESLTALIEPLMIAFLGGIAGQPKAPPSRFLVN